MNLGIKNIWSINGGGTSQELETLKTKVETNTTNITSLTNDKADKTTVTSLANVAAKTNISNTFTANQNVNGQVKVNASAESLVINSTGDKFIAFKNGNTREAYIGRSSSASRDIEINTGTGNLKINTANNISANNNIELSAGKSFKGLSITLGFGGTPVISPDEGTTKPLRFSSGNVRFGSLDFQNQTKLANVANIKTETIPGVANNTSQQWILPRNTIVLMVRRDSNGANHNNWKLLNSGTLTITNDVGSTESFTVTYWEI